MPLLKTFRLAAPAPLRLGRGLTRTIWSAALVLMLTTGLAQASESEAGQQGADIVTELCSRVDRMVRDASLTLEQRRRSLGELLISRFALEKMSRFLLAEQWQSIPSGKKDEFRRLLGQYIIATFGQHFESAPYIKLDVVAARQTDEASLRVRTRLDLGEPDAPLAISWRMSRSGQIWEIFDVVVQGVSMVAVLRSEFASVIKSDGGRVEGLIAKLREKAAGVGAGV